MTPCEPRRRRNVGPVDVLKADGRAGRDVAGAAGADEDQREDDDSHGVSRGRGDGTRAQCIGARADELWRKMAARWQKVARVDDAARKDEGTPIPLLYAALGGLRVSAASGGESPAGTASSVRREGRRTRPSARSHRGHFRLRRIRKDALIVAPPSTHTQAIACGTNIV